ncbi:MAG: thiamine pyrophosphate-dependent enzyme [Bacillota bacterium]|nr:thiamine pyrophosphate-dependent enzyme [Bacillota bacterium]MDI3298570.1 thiamine pyrophosphate-dependent enzyme [Bacillota bacterium]
MAITQTRPQERPELAPIRTIRDVPVEEFYTSGHRTCQGCHSALLMKYLAKAAGPRTVTIGATGCMYVANTSYYATPWVIPWMHTQLGATGSAVIGAAAGYAVQQRKGKLAEEPINVIGIAGDGGGADMGLSAISAALQHTQYNVLIILYDNESYANTDIQASGSTPWGAVTAFTPSGTVKRITQDRWKKNTPGMLVAGHPEARYIGSASAAFGVDVMNKIRTALRVGGPTYLHVHDACPKGWDFDPRYSRELGQLAVECGIVPLWEVIEGELQYNGITRQIVEGRRKRKPVREYLMRQGRFAHFTEEDVDYFQAKVDEMWEKWILPGVLPVQALPEGLPKPGRRAAGLADGAGAAANGAVAP